MPEPPPDRGALCAGFLDAVPHALYPYQEDAVLAWFECQGGLLVMAPTGMGKTLVAETAVYEALHTGKQLYYTTPLIALTDQKLLELQARAEAWGFPRESIGLLTGNRKLNPDAPVKVVVAEILLNHLLEPERRFEDVSAVVMDEFHSLNDRERGVVWELSLALLPAHVRVLLLSATIGNPFDVLNWLREQHSRTLSLVRTDERKVPLGYHWVEDKLLNEHLVDMVVGSADAPRVPALVFCFSRDECWELAERLKGLPLISADMRAQIEALIEESGETLEKGIAAKLRGMLIRGVGVHHAGVLPRYRTLVEKLFLARLVPYVVCTETLAAGINLPARSVVLVTLLKGKPGDRKLLPAASAHQMFGRAGRPQFDDQGFVYALAHEDDVRILRWKQKYDQIPAGTKNPGLLAARKQLERKRPSRRKTEQYWSEGQFKSLVAAGPAKLQGRSGLPLRVLVHLLMHDAELATVRRFLQRRLLPPDQLATQVAALEAQLENLAALGHIVREPGSDRVQRQESFGTLLDFRSVDPLFGHWLAGQLVVASQTEKLLALEALLDLPPPIARRCRPPVELAIGPLQEHVLQPLMLKMGVPVAPPPGSAEAAAAAEAADEARRARVHSWEWETDEEREENRPRNYAEMLVIAFEAQLPHPEGLQVQAKWVAGAVHDAGGEFGRFIASHDLGKNEGLLLRHLLRLVLLLAEFEQRTGDPQYAELLADVTESCRKVDPHHTERVLESAQEQRALLEG